MSKELWFDAYQDKLFELESMGITGKMAEEQAIEYAEGYLERLIDQISMMEER